MNYTEKVIIIDDEPIILSGLENWLSREYKTLTYDSADNFLTAFNSPDSIDGLPTCILLDFQMPGINGIELQENLRVLNSRYPIIFMSGNAQQQDIINAWRGGAVDFILKPFTPVQVTDALKKHFNALKEQETFQHNIENKQCKDIPITKREAEVLLLLGNGQQQIDVANALGISLRTVKMYRTFLKNKLGLNSAAEIGRFCLEHESAIEEIAKKIKA